MARTIGEVAKVDDGHRVDAERQRLREGWWIKEMEYLDFKQYRGGLTGWEAIPTMWSLPQAVGPILPSRTSWFRVIAPASPYSPGLQARPPYWELDKVTPFRVTAMETLALGCYWTFL